MPEPDLPGQQVESGSALPGAPLRTKLYRPRVSGEILHRERLHHLLGRTLAVPLTVVSGPAGYGKSTAVSDWCSTAAVPNAWVSLDAEDGDPIICLSYVIAAMRTIMPAACPQTGSYLSAPKPPPISVVVKTLVNELDAIREPWVLALDDYHRIEAASPVHEILNRILDHPPKSLHLVIMTRRDPPIRMAALRGGGLMMEVRLQDLRFTESETVAFLEESARVAVGQNALSNLQDQTEGWAVDLRLVSLYLQTADDPEAFLTTFRGGTQHVREYLVEEVLSRQPVDVREALLKTSLLDRFCAGLCDSVRTNASGSRP